MADIVDIGFDLDLSNLDRQSKEAEQKIERVEKRAKSASDAMQRMMSDLQKMMRDQANLLKGVGDQLAEIERLSKMSKSLPASSKSSVTYELKIDAGTSKKEVDSLNLSLTSLTSTVDKTNTSFDRLNANFDKLGGKGNSVVVIQETTKATQEATVATNQNTEATKHSSATMVAAIPLMLTLTKNAIDHQATIAALAVSMRGLVVVTQTLAKVTTITTIFQAINLSAVALYLSLDKLSALWRTFLTAMISVAARAIEFARSIDYSKITVASFVAGLKAGGTQLLAFGAAVVSSLRNLSLKDISTAITGFLSNLPAYFAFGIAGAKELASAIGRGLKNAFTSTQTSIKEFGKEIQDTANSTKMLDASINNTGISLKKLILIGAGVGVAFMGISAISDSFNQIVETGKAFEYSMSKVKAISLSSLGAEEQAKQFEQLSAKAREAGASTAWSASQAADALTYMGMAGWNTNQMLASLDPMLNLATAGSIELARASDIVTDVLSAMQIDTTNMGNVTHAIDVMTKTFTTSNTNLEMMYETMKYAAPVFAAAGYSIEDLAASTGLLANIGIKGSQSGTALRAIILRLANPARMGANALDELGIAVNSVEMEQLTSDSNTAISALNELGISSENVATGGMNSLGNILSQLATKLGPSLTASFAAITDVQGNIVDQSTGRTIQLSEAMMLLTQASQGSVNAASKLKGMGLDVQQALVGSSQALGYIAAIAGQEAAPALLGLVAQGAVIKDTFGNTIPSAFDAYKKKLVEAKGTTEDVSEIMQDNLRGDILTLESATEELMLTIYDEIKGALRSITRASVVWVLSLTSAVKVFFTILHEIGQELSFLAIPFSVLPVGSVYTSIVSGLGQVLSILKEVTKFVWFAQKLVVEFFLKGIADGLKPLVSAFDGVKSAIIEAFEPLVVALQPVISAITKVILQVQELTNVGGEGKNTLITLAGVAHFLGKIIGTVLLFSLKAFANVLAFTIDFLGVGVIWFVKLGQFLGELAAQVWVAADGFSAFQTFIGVIAGSLALFVGDIIKIVNLFQTAFTAIFQDTPIVEFTNALSASIAGVTVAFDGVERTTSPILDLFSGVSSSLESTRDYLHNLSVEAESSYSSLTLFGKSLYWIGTILSSGLDFALVSLSQTMLGFLQIVNFVGVGVVYLAQTFGILVAAFKQLLLGESSLTQFKDSLLEAFDSMRKDFGKIEYETMFYALSQSLAKILYALFAVKLVRYVDNALSFFASSIAVLLKKYVVNALAAIVKGVLSAIAAVVRLAFTSLALWIMGGTQDQISKEYENFKQSGKEVTSGITDGIKEYLGRAKEAGLGIVTSIGEGVREGAAYLWESIVSLFNSVVNLFPHSPAKEGPLSGDVLPGAGRGIVETIADGIYNSFAYLYLAVQGLMEIISDGVSSFRLEKTSEFASSLYASYISPIITALKDGSLTVSQAITDFVSYIFSPIKLLAAGIRGLSTYFKDLAYKSIGEEGATGFFVSAWDKFGKETSKSIVDAILGMFFFVLGTLTGAIASIVEGFSGFFFGVWASIFKAILGVFDTLYKTFTAGSISDAFYELFSGILGVIGGIIEDSFNNITTLLDTVLLNQDAIILGLVMVFAGNFVEIVGSAFAYIATAIGNKIPWRALKSAFLGLFFQLSGFILTAFEWAIMPVLSGIDTILTRMPLFGYVYRWLKSQFLEFVSKGGLIEKWVMMYLISPIADSYYGGFYYLRWYITNRLPVVDLTKIILTVLLPVSTSRMSKSTWNAINHIRKDFHANMKRIYEVVNAFPTKQPRLWGHFITSIDDLALWAASTFPKLTQTFVKYAPFLIAAIEGFVEAFTGVWPKNAPHLKFLIGRMVIQPLQYLVDVLQEALIRVGKASIVEILIRAFDALSASVLKFAGIAATTLHSGVTLILGFMQTFFEFLAALGEFDSFMRKTFKVGLMPFFGLIEALRALYNAFDGFDDISTKISTAFAGIKDAFNDAELAVQAFWMAFETEEEAIKNLQSILYYFSVVLSSIPATASLGLFTAALSFILPQLWDMARGLWEAVGGMAGLLSISEQTTYILTRVGFHVVSLIDAIKALPEEMKNWIGSTIFFFSNLGNSIISTTQIIRDSITLVLAGLFAGVVTLFQAVPKLIQLVIQIASKGISFLFSLFEGVSTFLYGLTGIEFFYELANAWKEAAKSVTEFGDNLAKAIQPAVDWFNQIYDWIFGISQLLGNILTAVLGLFTALMAYKGVRKLLDFATMGKSLKQARDYLDKNPLLVAMGIDERKVAKNIQKGGKTASDLLKGAMAGCGDLDNCLPKGMQKGLKAASKASNKAAISLSKDFETGLSSGIARGFAFGLKKRNTLQKSLFGGEFYSKKGSKLAQAEADLANINRLIGSSRKLGGTLKAELDSVNTQMDDFRKKGIQTPTHLLVKEQALKAEIETVKSARKTVESELDMMSTILNKRAAKEYRSYLPRKGIIGKRTDENLDLDQKRLLTAKAYKTALRELEASPASFAKEMGTRFSSLFTSIQSGFIAVGKTESKIFAGLFSPLIKGFRDLRRNISIHLLSPLLDGLRLFIRTLQQAVTAPFKWLYNQGKSVGSWFGALGRDAGSRFSSAFSNFANTFLPTFSRIGKAILAFFSPKPIQEQLKQAKKALIDFESKNAAKYAAKGLDITQSKTYQAMQGRVTSLKVQTAGSPDAVISAHLQTKKAGIQPVLTRLQKSNEFSTKQFLAEYESLTRDIVSKTSNTPDKSLQNVDKYAAAYKTKLKEIESTTLAERTKAAIKLMGNIEELSVRRAYKSAEKVGMQVRTVSATGTSTYTPEFKKLLTRSKDEIASDFFETYKGLQKIRETLVENEYKGQLTKIAKRNSGVRAMELEELQARFEARKQQQQRALKAELMAHDAYYNQLGYNEINNLRKIGSITEDEADSLRAKIHPASFGDTASDEINRLKSQLKGMDSALTGYKARIAELSKANTDLGFAKENFMRTMGDDVKYQLEEYNRAVTGLANAQGLAKSDLALTPTTTKNKQGGLSTDVSMAGLLDRDFNTGLVSFSKKGVEVIEKLERDNFGALSDFLAYNLQREQTRFTESLLESQSAIVKTKKQEAQDSLKLLLGKNYSEKLDWGDKLPYSFSDLEKETRRTPPTPIPPGGGGQGGSGAGPSPIDQIITATGESFDWVSDKARKLGNYIDREAIQPIDRLSLGILRLTHTILTATDRIRTSLVLPDGINKRLNNLLSLSVQEQAKISGSKELQSAVDSINSLAARAASIKVREYDTLPVTRSLQDVSEIQSMVKTSENLRDSLGRLSGFSDITKDLQTLLDKEMKDVLKKQGDISTRLKGEGIDESFALSASKTMQRSAELDEIYRSGAYKSLTNVEEVNALGKKARLALGGITLVANELERTGTKGSLELTEVLRATASRIRMLSKDLVGIKAGINAESAVKGTTSNISDFSNKTTKEFVPAQESLSKALGKTQKGFILVGKASTLAFGGLFGIALSFAMNLLMDMAYGGAYEAIYSNMDKLKEKGIKFAETFGDAFSASKKAILSVWAGMWDEIFGFLYESEAGKIARGIIDSIIAWFEGASIKEIPAILSAKVMQGVVEEVPKAFAAVQPLISSQLAITIAYWQEMYTSFGAVIKGISDSAGIAAEKLVSILEGLHASAVNIVSGWMSDFSNLFSFEEAGEALIVTFSQGITSAANYLKQSIIAVFEWVSSLFPHSDAEEGPFSTLFVSGEALIHTLADGIRSAGTDIYNALVEVFSFDTTDITDSVISAAGFIGDTLSVLPTPVKEVGTQTLGTVGGGITSFGVESFNFGTSELDLFLERMGEVHLIALDAKEGLNTFVESLDLFPEYISNAVKALTSLVSGIAVIEVIQVAAAKLASVFASLIEYLSSLSFESFAISTVSAMQTAKNGILGFLSSIPMFKEAKMFIESFIATFNSLPRAIQKVFSGLSEEMLILVATIAKFGVVTSVYVVFAIQATRAAVEFRDVLLALWNTFRDLPIALQLIIAGFVAWVGILPLITNSLAVFATMIGPMGIMLVRIGTLLTLLTIFSDEVRAFASSLAEGWNSLDSFDKGMLALVASIPLAITGLYLLGTAQKAVSIAFLLNELALKAFTASLYVVRGALIVAEVATKAWGIALALWNVVATVTTYLINILTATTIGSRIAVYSVIAGWVLWQGTLIAFNVIAGIASVGLGVVTSGVWALTAAILANPLTWLLGLLAAFIALIAVMITDIGGIRSVITGALNSLYDWMTSLTGLGKLLTAPFVMVYDFFLSFRGILTGIIQIFEGDIAEGFANIGWSIVGALTAPFKMVYNVFKGGLQSLRNLLPFSPPKDQSSPLFGLEESGAAIIDMLSSGVTDNAPMLTEAMRNATGEGVDALAVPLPKIALGTQTTFFQNSAQTASLVGQEAGKAFNTTFSESVGSLNQSILDVTPDVLKRLEQSGYTIGETLNEAIIKPLTDDERISIEIQKRLQTLLEGSSKATKDIIDGINKEREKLKRERDTYGVPEEALDATKQLADLEEQLRKGTADKSWYEFWAESKQYTETEIQRQIELVKKSQQLLNLDKQITEAKKKSIDLQKETDVAGLTEGQKKLVEYTKQYGAEQAGIFITQEKLNAGKNKETELLEELKKLGMSEEEKLRYEYTMQYGDAQADVLIHLENQKKAIEEQAVAAKKLADEMKSIQDEIDFDNKMQGLNNYSAGLEEAFKKLGAGATLEQAQTLLAQMDKLTLNKALQTPRGVDKVTGEAFTEQQLNVQAAQRQDARVYAQQAIATQGQNILSVLGTSGNYASVLAGFSESYIDYLQKAGKISEDFKIAEKQKADYLAAIQAALQSEMTTKMQTEAKRREETLQAELSAYDGSLTRFADYFFANFNTYFEPVLTNISEFLDTVRDVVFDALSGKWDFSPIADAFTGSFEVSFSLLKEFSDNTASVFKGMYDSIGLWFEDTQTTAVTKTSQQIAKQVQTPVKAVTQAAKQAQKEIQQVVSGPTLFDSIKEPFIQVFEWIAESYKTALSFGDSIAASWNKATTYFKDTDWADIFKDAGTGLVAALTNARDSIKGALTDLLSTDVDWKSIDNVDGRMFIRRKIREEQRQKDLANYYKIQGQTGAALAAPTAPGIPSFNLQALPLPSSANADAVVQKQYDDYITKVKKDSIELTQIDKYRIEAVKAGLIGIAQDQAVSFQEQQDIAKKLSDLQDNAVMSMKEQGNVLEGQAGQYRDILDLKKQGYTEGLKELELQSRRDAANAEFLSTIAPKLRDLTTSAQLGVSQERAARIRDLEDKFKGVYGKTPEIQAQLDWEDQITSTEEIIRLSDEYKKVGLTDYQIELLDAVTRFGPKSALMVFGFNKMVAASKKVAETVKELSDDLATIGMSEPQKKLYELSQSMTEAVQSGGMTKEKADAEIARVKALMKGVEITKRKYDLEKERNDLLLGGDVLAQYKAELQQLGLLSDLEIQSLALQKAKNEVLSKTGESYKTLQQYQLTGFTLDEQAAKLAEIQMSMGSVLAATGVSAEDLLTLQTFSDTANTLKDTYKALVDSGLSDYEQKVAEATRQHGEEIGKVVTQYQLLADANKEVTGLQQEIQLAGLTGMDRRVAEKAQQYGGDIDVAKEIVSLERQRDATTKLAEAQKQLDWAGYTEAQRQYLELSEEIGASDARRVLELQQQAEQRSAGMEALQSAYESMSLAGLSSEAQDYYDKVKDIAPEYRSRVLLLEQENNRIQEQRGLYDGLIDKVSDYGAKIATGQVSAKQGLKDMAKDVLGMLQEVQAKKMKEQIAGLFGLGSGDPVQDALKAAQENDIRMREQFNVQVEEVSLKFGQSVGDRVEAASKQVSSLMDQASKRAEDTFTKVISQLDQSLTRFSNNIEKATGLPTTSGKEGSGGSGGFFNGLGSVSAKYESGGRGVSTISTGAGDPGGVSYGTHQLASNTGTMQKFLSSVEGSAYGSLLKGLQIGSKEFNTQYLQIANTDGAAFAKAQHDYITRTHYQPLEQYASKAMDTSNKAIQEMLYSASVQHGNASKVVDMFADNTRGQTLDIDNTIKEFYKARTEYVQGLESLPAQVKDALSSRYQKEMNDVLGIAHGFGGEVDKAGKASGEFANKAISAGNSLSGSSKTIVDTATNTINQAGQTLSSGLGSATNTINQAGQTLSSGLGSATNTINQAGQTLSSGLDRVVDATTSGIGSAVQLTQQGAMQGAQLQIQSGQMLVQGSARSAQAMMSSADMMVAAIHQYASQTPGAQTPGTQANSNLMSTLAGLSKGNASGIAGVVAGSAQDAMLAEQMAGFYTGPAWAEPIATGFNSITSGIGSFLKPITTELTGMWDTAKTAFTGFTDSIGLTGANGLLGDLGGLSNVPWMQIGQAALSLFQGDTKGAVTAAGAIAGQMLIPIPVLGGFIGQAVGGWLADTFIGGETRSGAAYSYDAAKGVQKIQGPSGGEIAGDRVRTDIEEANKQANALLELFGSSARIEKFTAALESSENDGGGVWAGGVLSSGQSFGEQFSGQNVFESQTGRTLNAEEAYEAFKLDLEQVKLQALQAAEDVPDWLSKYLEGIDIESLDIRGIQSLYQNLQTIGGMVKSLTGLGVLSENEADYLIEVADKMGNSEDFGKFAEKINFYVSNFMEETDIMASNLRNFKPALLDSFSELKEVTGGTLPLTREGFADLVNGLDLTNESGQQLFTTLMENSEAMDAYYKSLEYVKQNFLAEAPELNSTIFSKATAMFNELGMEIPKTAEEFGRLVLGLDATNAEQAELQQRLLAVSPLMKQYYDAITGLGNAYTQAFGTPAQQVGAQIDGLRTAFDSLGVALLTSQAEYQSLVDTLMAGTDEQKAQAAALMTLYPQWQTAHDSFYANATDGLTYFTGQLLNLKNSISQSDISGALGNAVKEAKSPQEAGEKFAAAFSDMVTQQMTSTVINTVSMMVMNSIVTPMMQAAMMQAGQTVTSSATASGMLTTGGATGANALMAGSANSANMMMAGGSAVQQFLISSGMTAAQALATGGATAQAYISAAVADIKATLKVMGDVMADPEIKDMISGIVSEMGGVGAAAYTAIQPMQQLATTVTDLSNATGGASDAQGEAEKAADEYADKLKEIAKQIRGYLDDLLLGEDSPLKWAEKYGIAMKQYQVALEAARNGDLEAAGQLTELAGGVLKLAKEGYGDSSDYTRIFTTLTDELALFADGIDGLGKTALESANRVNGLSSSVDTIGTTSGNIGTAKSSLGDVKRFSAMQDAVSQLQSLASDRGIAIDSRTSGALQKFSNAAGYMSDVTGDQANIDKMNQSPELKTAYSDYADLLDTVFGQLGINTDQLTSGDISNTEITKLLSSIGVSGATNSLSSHRAAFNLTKDFSTGAMKSFSDVDADITGQKTAKNAADMRRYDAALQSVNSILGDRQNISGLIDYLQSKLPSGGVLDQTIIDALRGVDFNSLSEKQKPIFLSDVIDKLPLISDPSLYGPMSYTRYVGVTDTPQSRAAHDFILQGITSSYNNLPKLATGGIVSSPTIAMIGEAGPEAVVPLNDTGVSQFLKLINSGDILYRQAAIQSLPAFGDGGIVYRPTMAVIGENGPEAVTPLSQGYNTDRDGNDETAEEVRALREEVSRLLEAQLESERVTQRLIDELRKQGDKNAATTNETLDRSTRRSQRTDRM